MIKIEGNMVLQSEKQSIQIEGQKEDFVVSFSDWASFLMLLQFSKYRKIPFGKALKSSAQIDQAIRIQVKSTERLTLVNGKVRKVSFQTVLKLIPFYIRSLFR
ncbi:MAG: hypothetical protein AAF616_11970 [Bacteroidota bacterium]